MQVAQAVARGVVFELCYSELLQDQSSRRWQINNAQQLTRASRGRGIIISSRARRPLETRDALDVANMGFLFGLDPSAAQVRPTILVCCTKLSCHRQLSRPM